MGEEKEEEAGRAHGGAASAVRRVLSFGWNRDVGSDFTGKAGGGEGVRGVYD